MYLNFKILDFHAGLDSVNFKFSVAISQSYLKVKQKLYFIR